MLDFLGTLATITTMVLIVVSLLVYMDAQPRAKLVAGAIAGFWIALAAAAGAAGWLALQTGVPAIALFVATPIAAAAVLAAASSRVRAAMLSVPLFLLVALNAGRAFAVLFLLLEAEGRLAGPFPFFAGWGDIVTAVIAIPLAITAARNVERSRSARVALHGWNLFGIADLLLALALGITSSEGSPLQIIHAPPGSAAMQHLPFSFVPTVLVPVYLIMHGVVWAQLLRAGRTSGLASRTSWSILRRDDVPADSTAAFQAESR
jgi:hypothetical protein